MMASAGRPGKWFYVGLLLVLVFYLPYFILGEDAVFRLHDSLEQYIAFFRLNAKYMLSPLGGQVPELFGGAPLGAIQANAFWPVVVLFRLFAPLTAFVIYMAFIALAGYTGMYLLARLVLGGQVAGQGPQADFVAGGVAFSFAMLPFIPPYGLEIMGVPLAAYAICRLSFKPPESTAGCWAALIIYGLCSSPVLSGYYIVGVLVLLLAASFFVPGLVRRNICGQLLVLAVCYALNNAYIFYDMLHYPGHRLEFRLPPTSALAAFKAVYWDGITHALTYSHLAITVTIVTILHGAWQWHRGKRPPYWGRLLGLFLLSLAIALFYVFCHSETGIAWRYSLGTMRSFQFDRLYTAYPTLWALALALAVSYWASWLQGCLMRLVTPLVLALVVVTVGMAIHINPDYLANVKKIFGHQTGQISWGDFFDEPLFAAIDSAIGEDKSSYRVVSIGISPTLALYNGFYCLDGYSQSYPLAYKHEFREIMAAELAKSGRNRVYFDDWGSRCYIFPAELNGDFDIYAADRTIKQLELDTVKLAGMGGRFILSAAAIENAAANNLSLRQKFTSQRTGRVVYLYENNWWGADKTREGR